MHFTRLRLLGFKSFVDPTELVIAPGLTGVVGPNGCGKSNLLEALRWVMGENRPSVMRGDGMEDVIFAGSAARPARGHAEVTLTIDNRDRTAPAGFNDADDLTIIRRITRDAGSAYRVGGREARARDVAMLFADASTGAASPALVRQGQIAELINARPKARRRILEEAAGISGLYQRRHEAELKLRATEANLARIADVLEALDGQLASLARQARQAARYREIAEALRRAEALLLWRHWHDAEAARAEAAAALLAATRAAGAAQAEAAAAARAARGGGGGAAGAARRGRDRRRRAAAPDARARPARCRGRGGAPRDRRARRPARPARRRPRARDGARPRRRRDGRPPGRGARRARSRRQPGTSRRWRPPATPPPRRRPRCRSVEASFDGRAEAAARLVAEHQAAGRAVEEARRRAGEVARGARRRRGRAGGGDARAGRGRGRGP